MKIFFVEQAPVAIKKWNGIKNADKYGQRCPQLGDLAQMTEAQRKGLDVEDCLSLCVYSKKVCSIRIKTIL